MNTEAMPSTVQKTEAHAELRLWIERYEKRLLSLAYSILNDAHLAEDCVQETFIKAGLKSKQLRDPSRVFPWISRILVNECRTQLRSNWKRRIVTQDKPIEIAQFDNYPSAQRDELHSAVMGLPYKWRMAVILFYYHDFSVTEVADVLRVNDSTCRVWLHRARQRLRELMEGEYVGEND